jgi:hypothetical protein
MLGGHWDRLLDRYTAAGDFAMCVMSAEIAAVLLLRLMRAPRRATGRRAVAGDDMEHIFISLAVMFAAYTARLMIVSGGRYGVITWGSFAFDILLLTSTLSILAGGLWIVRSATRASCGWSAVLTFGALPVVIGATAAFMWS